MNKSKGQQQKKLTKQASTAKERRERKDIGGGVIGLAKKDKMTAKVEVDKEEQQQKRPEVVM